MKTNTTQTTPAPAPDAQPVTAALKPGALYHVRVRNWDFERGQHKPGNVTLRRFIGTEHRAFPGVQCYVFSARITRRSDGSSGELSVPRYDLISASAAAGGETAGSATGQNGGAL